MEQSKTCTKCGQIKPLSEFHKFARSPDGHKPRCKPCNYAEAEQWRMSNPERAAQTRKAWAENNKEKSAEIKRNYWIANPRKVAESSKKWQQANKAHVKAVADEWVRNNRHLVNSQAARRRAKKKANKTFCILPRDLKRLYAANCHYCQEQAPIEADHVISVDYGGDHGIGNLLPACRTCNASKGNKTIMEWLTKGNPPTAYAQLRGFRSN